MSIQVQQSGISQLLDDRSNETWRFRVSYWNGSIQLLGFEDYTGKFTYTGAPSGISTWQGDNPTFTNETGSTASPFVLGVGLPDTQFTGAIKGIGNAIFDPVELSPGDTIIFTSIQIEFTSEFPATAP